MSAPRWATAPIAAFAVLAVPLVFLALPVQAQNAGAAIPVRAAVGIEPDTVRVGDPFVIQVGILAPRGATVAFPPPPDSTGVIQALDPTRLETRPDTAGVVQWAYYRVAAWDIGNQPIQLDDVEVQLGGQVRRIPLRGHSVFVASVLPADSAQRVPKPPRSLFLFGAAMWWLWALLVAVTLLLFALWWWWRRRRRQAPVPAVDPYEQAEREFARIDKLGLIAAGERGRYVALVAEVLRDYLAARYEVAPLSLTSTELLAALRGRPAVPYERLLRFLAETDLIKFARRPVSPQLARDLGREARALVTDEHAAAMAPAREKAA
jgi:hypothetical protein